jgi:hypothetical protein
MISNFHELTPGQMARLIDGLTIVINGCHVKGNVPDWSCQETCVNCGNDLGPHHLCSDCLEGLTQ